MKSVELKQVEHDIKVGNTCKYITPNITEDTLFKVDGIVIGFYIKDISKYSKKGAGFLKIANKEFLSDRVPKSMMRRSSGLTNKENEVQQYSTILGSIPPKPNMRRPYPSISSVHRHKTADVFIKSMYLLSKESTNIIKEIAPNIYEEQIEAMKEVHDAWRFGDTFTSSISNFNIAADYHIDRGNIKNTVNVIMTKRENSIGGCLNVPDYNATIEQADNSMLVYPAWRNIHGVTPIIESREGGYRNSLIFYPLKAFKNI